VLDGGVLRDVHHQRRLPHRGAGGDDDQIAVLESGRHLVEVAVARRDAGEAGSRLLQPLDVLERRPQDLLDPDEPLALVALRDLEDARLGLVEDLLDFALALLVDVADDLRGRVDQAPQQRLLAHDARVVLDVGGGRHRVEELRQVLQAADAVELAGLLELLADRDHVDHVPALEEPGHRPEHPAVGLTEEHRVVDVLDGARDRVAVDQHPAEHRDLGFRRGRGTAVVARVRDGGRCRECFGRVQRSRSILVNAGLLKDMLRGAPRYAARGATRGGRAPAAAAGSPPRSGAPSPGCGAPRPDGT
jgi:hypothetical protein